MKKMFLGLILFLAIGLFGAKNVQANNVPVGNEKSSTMTIDVKGSPEAYVFDVVYGANGTITVKVKVRNHDSSWYRVKVTPTSQINGVVVEGALYCSLFDKEEGTVTFHCKAGKEGEAEYCAAYTFNAEIVEQ